MKQGMALPVRTNKRGGAQLTKGTPYVEGIVRAAITPNVSRNPFQVGGGVDLGVDERIVFSLNGPGAVARVRRDVTRIFTRLRSAEIAKLSPENAVSSSASGEELTVAISYLEIDADSERSVESNLKNPGPPEPAVNYGR